MCDIEKRFPDYVQQPHYQILNNTTDTLSVIFPMQQDTSKYEISVSELYSHIVQIKPYPSNPNYPVGYLEQWIKCIDGVVELIPCRIDVNDKTVEYMLVVFVEDERKVERGIRLLDKELNGNKEAPKQTSESITHSLTSPQLVKQLVSELVRMAWLMKNLPTKIRQERLQQLIKNIRESNNGVD